MSVVVDEEGKGDWRRKIWFFLSASFLLFWLLSLLFFVEKISACCTISTKAMFGLGVGDGVEWSGVDGGDDPLFVMFKI